MGHLLALGRGNITLQTLDDMINKHHREVEMSHQMSVIPEALFLKCVHYDEDGTYSDGSCFGL